MTGDPIIGQLLLQLVLILVNAFFAATEIALLSLNENRLEKSVEDGDRKAALLLKTVRSPDSFLSAIQVGITLAGFLGSAFAAENFADRLVEWLINDMHVAISAETLGAISVVLITIVLSYFTLVLGELVPKRVAMFAPDKVARFSIGVISAIEKVMRPVIWLMSKSTNAVLRLMRVDPHKETEEVTEEEIRMMVDIGEEKGAIESAEKEMIENVFEFNNTTAGDVMTHRIDVKSIQADADADGDDIIELIAQTGLSRFPVYQDDIDDIIGVLNTRDYLLNLRLSRPKSIRELLREAYFVPESVRADVLFRDMQKRKIHLAIVVDEYGGTSGVVSMEDLLEEIVGNIYDEFDPLEEEEIQKLGDNLWRVSGSMPLETLEEALDTPLPQDEEYDTLGGLIFAQLTVVPRDGEQPEMDVCGLHVKVERIEDRRVEYALVSILPKQEDGDEDGERSEKSRGRK